MLSRFQGYVGAAWCPGLDARCRLADRTQRPRRDRTVVFRPVPAGPPVTGDHVGAVGRVPERARRSLEHPSAGTVPQVPELRRSSTRALGKRHGLAVPDRPVLRPPAAPRTVRAGRPLRGTRKKEAAAALPAPQPALRGTSGCRAGRRVPAASDRPRGSGRARAERTPEAAVTPLGLPTEPSRSRPFRGSRPLRLPDEQGSGF